jgi:hypothetical protein
VVYLDQFGLKKEINVDDLWGFCRRGSIYVNVGDDFNRIPVVGAICHFVAALTVYDEPYNNLAYGYNNYGNYNSPSVATRTDIYQFIMDFKTGEILEYSVANVKVFLGADKELYNEFVALRKKKQKQMKFLYIRKYNEKHPIQFSVDGNS